MANIPHLNSSMIKTCAVALKEWAVTCRALEEGRQIVLLRKGGILDAEGLFELEHTVFWLQPTYEHQSENLVKPEHRDLFGAVQSSQLPGENKRLVALRSWARAECVWSLMPEDEPKMRAASHIWSDSYLDLRFGYKPERPLLCVALRVYQPPEVHRLPMRDSFFGCRSWIDLDDPLPTVCESSALDDAAFARQKRELEAVLGAPQKTLT